MDYYLIAMAYSREYCVICNNNDFEIINTFERFPIMAISNDLVQEQYYDFVPMSCKKCGCLQIKNLVDQKLLYSNVYMTANFSPSWLDHYSHFAEFILKNTVNANFVEIGANKGDVYNIISKSRNVNYTVLDMHKHPELSDSAHFIEGDCETFDFSGFSSVIMSHVFEHLYSPRTFVENARKCDVHEIFISIPNFDELLKEQSLILIYSQHTFFCGFDYIVYLFSMYNYKCESHYFYNGNVKSTMFKFKLCESTFPVETPHPNSELYKEIYVDKINQIRNTKTKPNSYIYPAGIYGQLFYYCLSESDKSNIVGFLDNNSNRHNNTLYGTDKLTFHPNTIDYGVSNIIVCDCPYKQEILEDLETKRANVYIH